MARIMGDRFHSKGVRGLGIFLFVLGLLIASPAKAQYVQITGTVADNAGCVYQGGSGSAQLVPTNVNWTVSQGHTINQLVQVVVRLDGFGQFSIQLLNTGPGGAIDQQASNPQYQFRFQNADASIGFTMTPLSLTSSQDISTQIAAQAAPLNCEPAGTSKKVCMIVVGADNGSALANLDLGPQQDQCYSPYTATVLEVMVTANTGTPSVIPGVNHLGVTSNIVSGALSTAASGGRACSNATATVSFDGTTICSGTLINTSVASGDFLQLVSGTAGGSASRMTIQITYLANDGSGGGSPGPPSSGTVTNFLAGNLPPLFTTSVATPTTTPLLTFTLTNAAANKVFGNCTGSPAAPAYISITTSCLPFTYSGTGLNLATAGTLAGTHVSTCTDGSGNITTVGCPLFPTFIPAVQSVTTKLLAGNVDLTPSVTPVQIDSQAITMPSSGCPCRVLISYSYSDMPVSGASTPAQLLIYVTDGSVNYAGSGCVIFNVNAGCTQGTSDVSAGYASSASKTFQVMAAVQAASGHVTIEKFDTVSGVLQSFLRLTILTSVN